METTIDPKKKYSLSQVKDLLLKEIEDIRQEASLAKSKIYRIEIPIQDVPILDWLAHQTEHPLFHWSDREQQLEISGVGCADLVHLTPQGHEETFKKVQMILGSQRAFRYFGGCAFDPERLNDHWQDFSAGQFWIPRFEIRKEFHKTIFACNMIFLKEYNFDQVLQDLERLNFTTTKKSLAFPKPSERTDVPNSDQWASKVEQITESIRFGHYEKIVLARRTELKFDQNLEPFSLLKAVKKRTDQCYHFGFQIKAGTTFFGASPERLFFRKKRHLDSEAVAGTRPRGKNQIDDQNLKKELLASAKDHKEQRFVHDMLHDSFMKLCSTFSCNEEPTVMMLKEGMHLNTAFHGILKKNIHDLNILSGLHPTPAVSGTPAKSSIKTLKKLEDFSRGWYSGVVGYFGADESEMVVAIRSALLHDQTLSVYAGAGIIADSQAPDEWQEIENKIKIYREIFQHGSL